MKWATKGYANGAEYEGYVDDEGRRQTKGRLRDDQGGVYIGEWQDMKMEGRGWYRWKNGARYAGSFAEDAFAGRGVYEEKGLKYVGGYKDGRKHGTGMLWGADGTVLVQTWADGVLETSARPEEHRVLAYVQEHEGIEGEIAAALPTVDAPTQQQWDVVVRQKAQTLPSGSKYEGGFLNKKRHGYGVWTHPEGDRYEGLWRENKKAGWGTYVQSNGRKYVGQWKGDKMDGWGVYFFSDTECFVGRYKADHKEDTGVHFKPEGALTQVWGRADGKIESEVDATPAEVDRFAKLRDEIVRIVDAVVDEGKTAAQAAAATAAPADGDGDDDDEPAEDTAAHIDPNDE